MTAYNNYNQNNGIQSVLTASLGIYRVWGFKLVELNRSTLLLQYNSNLLGVFEASVATIADIRSACHDYLEYLSTSAH